MKAVWLSFAFAVGIASGTGLVLARQAPPEPKKEEPPFRSLDANLFMQTAAEYQACCHQAFNWAQQIINSTTMNPYSGPPRAVVLDLDETVIDNGRFQSTMIRKGWGYDQRIWDEWEKHNAEDVGLIPGAKAFLEFCKSRSLVVFYISNRSEKNRAGTKAVLDRLGIAVPDEQLLLATTTSDKTARRANVEARFNVILHVGDNLRDFDERFKYDAAKGVAGRKTEVDATKSDFGSKWIILPNPAYGEWAKPFGKGTADADLLSPNFDIKP